MASRLGLQGCVCSMLDLGLRFGLVRVWVRKAAALRLLFVKALTLTLTPNPKPLSVLGRLARVRVVY